MKQLIPKFQKYLCLSSSLVLLGMASSANAFQLDFLSVTSVVGNLTNSNSDNNGATLRFVDVGTENGTTLDLLITVTGSYTPRSAASAANNGVAGNAGQISVRSDTTNDFRFEIVETGTSNPFVADEIEFDFFDVEGGNTAEFVTVSSAADFTLRDNTVLNVTDDGSSITFLATGGTVPNPTNISNLTNAQERVSGSLLFENTSGFDISYGTVGATGGGRTVFFTSSLVFDNGPVTTTNFQPVPFAFSPTLGLLLSGLGVFGLKKFRKQKMLN